MVRPNTPEWPNTPGAILNILTAVLHYILGLYRPTVWFHTLATVAFELLKSAAAGNELIAQGGHPDPLT